MPTVANYRVDEHASCARIASLIVSIHYDTKNKRKRRRIDATDLETVTAEV